MLAKVKSGAVLGIDAYIVEVEAHLEGSLPHFATVGLPDSTVRESKERVKAAIKNSGFRFPIRRTTINLAPAHIRKEGAAFDLPIAIGILAAAGAVNPQQLQRYVILGELGLDGSVRPIQGLLPIATELNRRKIRGMLCPAQNAREAAVTGGIEVIAIETLKEAVDFLNGAKRIKPFEASPEGPCRESESFSIDLKDVRGQEHVKRALEIAAAGGHNILLVGPPGSGKTMLARRLPTILPEMTLAEALETTKIHSVAGLLSDGGSLMRTRPFRAPHHTISAAGMIGGGSIPRPGEVSLAHHGVLFLDEFPEFRRGVLEVLRQPLEDGKVTLARASLSVSYPAGFTLAAAMNPCPCGYGTDPNRTCQCTPVQIMRYRSKISGPLLDRIDIHIEVPALRTRDFQSDSGGELSKSIRRRVEAARMRQTERYKGDNRIFCNARMEPREIQRFCRVNAGGAVLLKTAISRLGFSARAFDRILKVARTIADLDGRERIETDHISEAIQYRSLDRAAGMG